MGPHIRTSIPRLYSTIPHRRVFYVIRCIALCCIVSPIVRRRCQDSSATSAFSQRTIPRDCPPSPECTA